MALLSSLGSLGGCQVSARDACRARGWVLARDLENLESPKTSGLIPGCFKESPAGPRGLPAFSRTHRAAEECPAWEMAAREAVTLSWHLFTLVDVAPDVESCDRGKRVPEGGARGEAWAPRH